MNPYSINYQRLTPKTEIILNPPLSDCGLLIRPGRCGRGRHRPPWSPARRTTPPGPPPDRRGSGGRPPGNQVDILPTAISDLIMRSYGEYFYRIEAIQVGQRGQVPHLRPDDADVAVLHPGLAGPGLQQPPRHDLPEPIQGLHAHVRHQRNLDRQSRRHGPRPASRPAFWTSPTTPILTALAEMHEGSYCRRKAVRDDPAPGPRQLVGGRPTRLYVAVFDTATDTEIDTGMGAAEGFDGHSSAGKGPNVIAYQPELNKLIISCAGRYPYGDRDRLRVHRRDGRAWIRIPMR